MIEFERITLIGIGLIGSSLARDIRARGLAREIIVSTRSPETLRRAEELGSATAIPWQPKTRCAARTS